ncbi:uncharacterized protein [Gossypium hirsutum]|uniref:Retrovirus-related Pol polyprotein from transposon TNT 1-94 n=1 Tax=Gossypium hirsutum TaxID=3635 RepID=A0ABM3ASS8_GOSHI|nr:uncharacterized protein LOC121222059 [Gossypium hirsutum]
MVPYEALYGRKGRTPLCWTELGERQILGPELVSETKDKVRLIRDCLNAASDRQKSYADLKSKDIEYYRSNLSHVVSVKEIDVRPDLTFEKEPVHILEKDIKVLKRNSIPLVQIPCNPSCDANWVTDNDDVSSTSGYVFTLIGTTISWKSTKQTCIAPSTMESEFIAIDLAGQKVEWLRNLLTEILLCEKSTPLISLLCVSQDAICIAKRQAYNGNKRNIRIRHESMRHLIKNGVITLEYVRSERNLVDPLTKGISGKMIFDSLKGMSLKPSG